MLPSVIGLSGEHSYPCWPAQESCGITVHPNVFYLYPVPDGFWAFLNCADDSTSCYPDLEVAVRAALDAIIVKFP
jgi:hypothetical protein